MKKPPMKALGIRFTENQRIIIVREAKKLNTTISDILREIVDLYFKGKK